MRHRRSLFQSLMTHTTGALFLALSLSNLSAQTPSGSTSDTTVIRAETRLVLVDTVVTDKKGNYIRDLTQKDFRVWEDNKEQTVKTFSAETDASAPSGEQRRYLILFFDNSTMNMTDQSQARAAAL